MSYTGKIYASGCNWWCRRFSDVVDIGKAYINGGLIGAAWTLGDIIFSKGEFEDYAGGYVFTPGEELILDNWYYSYFEKFVQSITNIVEVRFATTTSSIKKVEYANDVLSKISAIRFANTLQNTSGLSTDAKNIRMLLVNSFLNATELAIKNEMKKTTNYSLIYSTVNVSAIDGITNTVVLQNCPQYTVNSNTSSGSGSVEFIEIDIPIETTNNGSNTVVDYPVENTIETPNNDSTNDQKTSKSSSFFGKAVLVGLGLWAGSKLFK